MKTLSERLSKNPNSSSEVVFVYSCNIHVHYNDGIMYYVMLYMIYIARDHSPSAISHVKHDKNNVLCDRHAQVCFLLSVQYAHIERWVRFHMIYVWAVPGTYANCL